MDSRTSEKRKRKLVRREGVLPSILNLKSGPRIF